MPTQPIDVVLATTYRCNARCIMCNIWQNPSENDLTPEEYRFLPSSLRYVNISGGEPFLRDDIPEIVAVVKERAPNAQIIISSNGFMPGKIEKLMKEVLKVDPTVGVGISIDGKGETHNHVRGIPKGFDKCMDTLTRLKGLGMTNLRLAFTVVDDNVEELPLVYKLTKELGVEFSMAVAQNSSHYFKTDQNNFSGIDLLKKNLGPMVEDLLKTSTPKNWLRAFFAHGVFRYAAGEGRPFVCNAASDFFFVDPGGDIYPCNIMERVLGNVRKDSFENIWASHQAEKIRGEVRACELRCWMVCTARTDMKRHAGQVGSWIMKNKTAAHLGNFELELPSGTGEQPKGGNGKPQPKGDNGADADKTKGSDDGLHVLNDAPPPNKPSQPSA
ncbi:MAG: radical SAM protein [Gemmatimonadetes bacterium]|nr:radical SAM protein [Gemmatimonadota bacterium]